MNCPIKSLECAGESGTAVYHEMAGGFAYYRCRQTGAMFVVMAAETHLALMARLHEAEVRQKRLLVDTAAEYVTDEELDELGLD